MGLSWLALNSTLINARQDFLGRRQSRRAISSPCPTDRPTGNTLVSARDPHMHTTDRPRLKVEKRPHPRGQEDQRRG